MANRIFSTEFYSEPIIICRASDKEYIKDPDVWIYDDTAQVTVCDFPVMQLQWVKLVSISSWPES